MDKFTNKRTNKRLHHPINQTVLQASLLVLMLVMMFLAPTPFAVVRHRSAFEREEAEPGVPSSWLNGPLNGPSHVEASQARDDAHIDGYHDDDDDDNDEVFVL